MVALNGKGGIDFGGVRVNSTESVLASSIAPKTPTFSIISPAYASAPVSSCIGDMPRTEGEVKNLATGKALKDFSTTEFFPGLNGRVWASKLNGHVATVGPVGVLRDNAKVAVEPNMQFISNYTVLHSRTDYEDDPAPHLRRHLLRLWLNTGFFKQLPPSYMHRYEDTVAWQKNPRPPIFDVSAVQAELAH